jgi:ABC-2 type transport system permease protein
VRKTFAVAIKELRQVARDPLSLTMLLGVPGLMLLMYGYAVNFDVRHVALAVQDRDHSQASRDLVASFVNSTYFDFAADVPVGADFERVTEERVARAILVIPEDYSRSLAAGRTASVQMLLDGADAGTATTVLGYAEQLIAQENVAIRAELLRRSGPVELTPVDYQPRVWYNPELRSTQFLVPGLAGFILMLTAVLSTALSVVREKERGTMEQLRITDLRIIELLVGKTLPYLGISLMATVIILAAARFLFGVAVRGPYLDLFAITLVYLIGALGFGLFVSSISDSQAMAFQVGTLTSMLPAIFLSGFIFPIRNMPLPLQAVTYIVPARYYLVILRGIILKGAGLRSYPVDVLYLIGFATVVLGLSYMRLVVREK